MYVCTAAAALCVTKINKQTLLLFECAFALMLLLAAVVVVSYSIYVCAAVLCEISTRNRQIDRTGDKRRAAAVCVCFLPIHSGHQVRWTYQPGSHRRKVTQDFSSTFFLRCVP